MKNTNKIIGIFIATAILSCQKPENPLDELELDVNLPAASTVIGFKFSDADSGEEIKSLDALITGSGSKRIGGIDLKQPTDGKTYKPTGEFFSLAVIPNQANDPSEGNPLKFDIKLVGAASGDYLQPSSTIELTEKGQYYYDIKLTKIKESAPGDSGVIMTKKTIKAGDSIPTATNKLGNSLGIKFSEGSGTATIRFIDADDEKAKATLPEVKLKGAVDGKEYNTLFGFKVDGATGVKGEATVNINSNLQAELDNDPNAELALFEETIDGEGNSTWAEAENTSRIGKKLPLVQRFGNRIRILNISNKYCRLVLIRTSPWTPPTFTTEILPKLNKLIVNVTLYNSRGSSSISFNTSLGNLYKNVNYIYKFRPRAIVINYNEFTLSGVSKANQLKGGPSLFLKLDELIASFNDNGTKTLKMLGVCSNNNITANGILLYRKTGTTVFKILGQVENGNLSTDVLVNGVAYDFRVDYKGTPNEITNELMSPLKNYYEVKVLLSPSECKGLK